MREEGDLIYKRKDNVSIKYPKERFKRDETAF